ncbi:MAG TPA: hypothetical protein VJN20_02370 [Burkholderiales bacterium]|nr:hypothetical protein [Burkholderiales bacterium]
MTSDHDRTVRLVRNLDRGAIEAKLAEVRQAAQSSNLADLASLFAGVEGMPRAQMQERITSALKWLAGKPGHQKIVAQLELVEINLPNLK